MAILKLKNINFTNTEALFCLVHDLDINKMVAFSKFPFCKKSFKYFICYKDAKKVIPLSIMLSKKNVYRRDFDGAKKCKEIWDKFSKNMKKGFDSKSAYNKKYIKPR